jgi:hypothetical protein
VRATEDLLIDIWQGCFSLPLNLPFSKFRKGLHARKQLLPIIQVHAAATAAAASGTAASATMYLELSYTSASTFGPCHAQRSAVIDL